jgi:hypothetical protein
MLVYLKQIARLHDQAFDVYRLAEVRYMDVRVRNTKMPVQSLKPD